MKADWWDSPLLALRDLQNNPQNNIEIILYCKIIISDHHVIAKYVLFLYFYEDISAVIILVKYFGKLIYESDEGKK